MTKALIKQLKSLGVKLAIGPLDDALIVDAPRGTMTPKLRESIEQNKSEIIAATKSELCYWLSRIVSLNDKEKIFSLVEEFRTFREWTDEERAELSRVYIRRIEAITQPTQTLFI